MADKAAAGGGQVMAKNIKITQVKSSAHAKQNMKGHAAQLAAQDRARVSRADGSRSGAVRTVRHLVTAEEVD